jgi:hypothetical protein
MTILSSFPPRPDFGSSHCSSASFTYPPSEIDMSLQSGSLLTLFPSYSSTSSESSGASVFSDISNQSESSCSSVYGEITPRKTAGQTLCLSESPTPVEDNRSFDADQLTLRLFIQDALSGRGGLPKWDGLAEALRVYFANSWHKDGYTLQQCEKEKEFLFWNAVADGKWCPRRG